MRTGALPQGVIPGGRICWRLPQPCAKPHGRAQFQLSLRPRQPPTPSAYQTLPSPPPWPKQFKWPPGVLADATDQAQGLGQEHKNHRRETGPTPCPRPWARATTLAPLVVNRAGVREPGECGFPLYIWKTAYTGLHGAGPTHTTANKTQPLSRFRCPLSNYQNFPLHKCKENGGLSPAFICPPGQPLSAPVS